MAKALSRRQKIEITVSAAAVVAYLFLLPAYLGSICAVLQQANKPAPYNLSEKGQQEKSHTYADKQAVGSPLVSKTEANGSAQPADETAEPPETWWHRFRCEVKASDWFIGLFTLFLAIATYFLWRETERLAAGADDQAAQMAASVAESARAATAMEGVSTAMTTNVERQKDSLIIQREIADTQKRVSEMQLRAYVSVLVGTAIYQERDKELRFEGRARLLNQGATPARKVTHDTSSGIFPIPLPKGFEFPKREQEPSGETMIGPNQERILSGVVPDYVDERDVPDVKIGKGRGLYVWGKITYEDAFGNPHETDFCHQLTWMNDGKTIYGRFVKNRNNSD